jgi:RNA polymerase sigma-70 factor, ECF subfamily
MDSAVPDITVLLREWAQGSRRAEETLAGLLYADLKQLSRRMLRGESKTQQSSTSLVHNMFLKLTRTRQIEFSGRRHFFAFCGTLMRQILTDDARRRLAEKREGITISLAGADEVPWFGQSAEELMLLNLVMERLREQEPQKAAVVELRLYAGCTAEETAEALGLSKATVDRHMSFAKAYLFRELRTGRQG